MKRLRCAGLLAVGFLLIWATGCAQTRTIQDDVSHAEGEEAMVSIGYGQIEKDNTTGSVATLTRDELERRKVTDATEMLAGRVSGVHMVNTSDGPRLRIRGIHTLMGSQDPLFVVDGTPLPPGFSGIRFLNPHDIEQIDVLKGAAASIYGSRGANGVVLITTRR